MITFTIFVFLIIFYILPIKHETKVSCFLEKLIHASISSNVNLTGEEGSLFCSSDNIMTYRASVFFLKLCFIWLEKPDVLYGAITFMLLHCDSQPESKMYILVY